MVLWHIKHCKLLMPNPFLYIKIVLFQTIRFSISTQLSSIWPIGSTLSGATTPGQSGPGRDGNEGILCIPQSFSITGTSPSDSLVPYSGHFLGGGLTTCREAVSLFYSPSQQGKFKMEFKSQVPIVTLVGLVLVLWHNNPCRLFNAKSSLNISNIYDLQTHSVDNIFKQAWVHSFAHSLVVSSFSNTNNSIYH